MACDSIRSPTAAALLERAPSSATYLDYNATAPLRASAWHAMQNVICQTSGNPASTHRWGQASRAILEKSRDDIAKVLGGNRENLIFTSGGTEANNLAIHGAAGAVERIIVSAIEHDAIVNPARQTGLPISTLVVTADGIIDCDALQRDLENDQRPALICAMLVNNETGIIQPLPEIVTIARHYGARVHTDAVQAIGKIPFSFQTLGVDSASVSAHKFGGPAGIGALLVREGWSLSPHIAGGAQEMGRRAGMQSPMLAEGFAAALSEACAALTHAEQSEVPGLSISWQKEFEERLSKIAPEAVIIGARVPRVASTTCLLTPGFSNEAQIMALNWDDIFISAGAACASGKVRPSPVLVAMGISASLARCAVRISWGYATARDDLMRCVTSWEAAYKRAVQRTMTSPLSTTNSATFARATKPFSQRING